MEENTEIEQYNPAEDPEFYEQAIQACIDVGLEEDEAEMMVEDYFNLY
jgi:hypothetical protein